MYVSAAVERTRSVVITLVVALSLLVSPLPASAGVSGGRGGDLNWDFLDPTNITWESIKPTNITWENALQSITWE